MRSTSLPNPIRVVEGGENYYQFRMKMWHQIKR